MFGQEAGNHYTDEDYEELFESYEELSQENERLVKALQDVVAACTGAQSMYHLFDAEILSNQIDFIKMQVVDALGDIKEDG